MCKTKARILQGVFAKASDWVVPGFIMSESINGTKKSSSNVSLLKPEELTATYREGRKENPIDVCDDSDEESLKCSEKYEINQEVNNTDTFSVDGTDVILETSDFDADT